MKGSCKDGNIDIPRISIQLEIMHILWCQLLTDVVIPDTVTNIVSAFDSAAN